MNRKERRAAAKTGKPPVNYQTARATTSQQVGTDALFADAMRHHQAGRIKEAHQICRQILASDPNHVNALHLSGLMALQVGLHEVARNMLSMATALNDRDPILYYNFGNALAGLGQLDDAAVAFRHSLSLAPGYAEAYNNLGNVRRAQGHLDEALACYHRAATLKPNFAPAHRNLGVALLDQGRPDDAIASFRRAVAIAPGFAEAFNGLGNALRYARESRNNDAAIAAYDQALALNPNSADALANRAETLRETGRFERSSKDFEQLLAIAPEYDYALGGLLHSRMLNSNWQDFNVTVQRIVTGVAAKKLTSVPFVFLNASDSPAEQLCCSQIFAKNSYPAVQNKLWNEEIYSHAKIRIAYLSADFFNHATAYLTAGLFEAHDRSRFETIAVSYGETANDEMHSRLIKAFSRFIDVERQSDYEVARALRELEVDIAIDLKGYTQGARPILAFRPAPVQVNYLGYPGTLGAEHVDYIIADRFLIPEDQQAFYDEKIVYLPDSYQPNDAGRRISGHAPSRVEAGLPPDRFVFCAFNNHYKITPPIFDVWARLLRQVEGSVLWLIGSDETTARNLRREAEARGVASDRLVFAPRVGLEDHLARHRLADLMLDTLPYNGHTTTSDALWAGLPVVTCSGSSFAGRVSGSLLHAVGLPELITHTLGDYEALALKLAREKETLAAVTAKLARNRETFPLFDTDRYRRHIESAYETMWARYQRGEPPAGFAVTPRAS